MSDGGSRSMGVFVVIALPLGCVAAVAWVAAHERGGAVQLGVVGVVIVVSVALAWRLHR